MKDIFPYPYFAELSDENVAEGLSQWRSRYDIEELELYNQKLKLKTFSNIENLHFIDELEKILKTN
ncbi:MAG: hypothetical protein J0L47_02350 [Flavobacteriales bacterium]|nr:hypothetical protein [Flavobacteriales bacterium]MCA0390405.1 hypothetical protein [Bacteroidota bacterium]